VKRRPDETSFAFSACAAAMEADSRLAAQANRRLSFVAIRAAEITRKRRISRVGLRIYGRRQLAAPSAPMRRATNSATPFVELLVHSKRDIFMANSVPLIRAYPMPFRSLFESTPLHSRAFRHFTNRSAEQEIFQRLIDAPAGGMLPALMFYGVGGAGKSWLLQKLQQNLGDAIPSARISFEPTSGSLTYATDFARALAALRHSMGTTFCPRFDIAYAWLRHKEGGSDEPQLRHSEHASNAWDLVQEGINSVPGGNFVTLLARKVGTGVWGRIKDSPLVRWLAEKTGQEDYLRLRTLSRDEIYAELPHRLIEDFATNLPARPDRVCRGVLFLDGYEWLMGDEAVAARRAHHDAWVRELYHPHSGVLLVLSGRDRLTWDAVQVDYARAEHLGQHLVSGLSEGDSRRFLTKCGIGDPALQDTILRVSIDDTSREPDGGIGYHAFTLGLCADTVDLYVQEARPVDPRTFDIAPGDLQQLAARFLRSLSDAAHERWIQRLALTPRFDEAAARAAFSPVRDVAQDAAWGRLDDYSFLMPAQPSGWWTLHPRMREAVAAIHDGRDDDHRWWQAYWIGRQAGDLDEFAGLAWFHHWEWNPSVALADWTMITARERQELRMAAHHGLLTWWNPTKLASGTGMLKSPIEVNAVSVFGTEIGSATLGSRSVNLHVALRCFARVLTIVTEDDSPHFWATTLNHIGVALRHLPAIDRAENLRRCVGCYEAALRVFTEGDYPLDWAMVQNNLGLALLEIHTDDREAHLLRAIDCLNAALRVRTETGDPAAWATTQNNLGIAYMQVRSGDRDADLCRAIECFNAALRVRTEKDSPDTWAQTLCNLGTAYAELSTGERCEGLQNAIACFEASLRVRTSDCLPHAWAESQLNIAMARATLAKLYGNDVDWQAAAAAAELAIHGFRTSGDARCEHMAQRAMVSFTNRQLPT